ncbi:S1C family serine protease [Virgibacillus xinjiangensis]|uniref:S1C family serine protease n=1 Tax=Virgibacillus xinjiangensis TaxID=393090 RepID=A0ABV7CRR2_9BACI
MDKDKETQQDIIDTDLYEDLGEEEIYEILEEERRKTWGREQEEEKKTKKPPFPRWIFWLIALVMLFHVAALLPQTFSIPAIEFLTTSARLSSQEDIQTYKEAVVVVETDDGKGTGFGISEEGTILTNHHVIEGEENVTVAFPEQGLFEADVVETHPSIDLAVLEVDSEEENLPYLQLEKESEFQEEEPVYFIGNPLRFNGIANEGSVIGSTQLDDWDQPVMMMDAPVYRGNSGSPVISMDGKVAGIVFATLRHEEHGRVGLFVPIDYFHAKYEASSLP